MPTSGPFSAGIWSWLGQSQWYHWVSACPVWVSHHPAPCTLAREGLPSPHLRDGSWLQTRRTGPRSHKVTGHHLCSGHVALDVNPQGLHLPVGPSGTLPSRWCEGSEK